MRRDVHNQGSSKRQSQPTVRVTVTANDKLDGGVGLNECPQCCRAYMMIALLLIQFGEPNTFVQDSIRGRMRDDGHPFRLHLPAESHEVFLYGSFRVPKASG